MYDDNAARDTVVVTGFGPFSGFEENPSWTAVQNLEAIGLGENINLVVKMIRVEYDHVNREIPNLWKKYKPTLMVLCGVGANTGEIRLEQLAHNDSYRGKDIKGKLPPNNCCHLHAPDTLISGIDMCKVRDRVNQSGSPITAVLSNDPGRYLCEYIYFYSLNINQRRTAFIHTPVIDSHTPTQIAECLRAAILEMLDQLK